VRSVEKAVSQKLVPSVVSEAVKANRPRPGFSAELLGALRDAPSLEALNEEPGPPALDRLLVPGVIAGAICGAGILFFELGRRGIRVKPAPRATNRRFG
jgi:hypothetical protein